jgi:hypothetical protein
MRRLAHQTSVAVCLTAVAVCLAACGSSSKKASPASTPATTTASAAASASSPSTASSPSAASSAQPSAAATTSQAAGGGDCGNAAVAVNVATNASPESDQVMDIEIVGGCASVTLHTALAAGDASAADTAVKICETASKPAYANGVGAVTVLAVGSKTVLATGTKGSACAKKS